MKENKTEPRIEGLFQTKEKRSCRDKYYTFVEIRTHKKINSKMVPVLLNKLSVVGKVENIEFSRDGYLEVGLRLNEWGINRNRIIKNKFIVKVANVLYKILNQVEGNRSSLCIYRFSVDTNILVDLKRVDM